MDERTARLARLGVVFGLLIVVLFVPLWWLNAKLNDTGPDAAYRDLAVYGRSLSGDASADGEAARISDSLNIRDIDGQEVYTKEGDGVCWLLNPAESFLPTKTEMELC